MRIAGRIHHIRAIAAVRSIMSVFEKDISGERGFGMKVPLLLSMILMIAVRSAPAAVVIQFNIDGAVNKDLVYESGGRADVFGIQPGGDQAYIEDGYNAGHGLPDSLTLSSSRAELGNYALMSFNGNNAIELNASASAPNVSYRIDVPDLTYLRLGLLVAGVDGNVSFGYTLNYTDMTTESAWWEADDWYQVGGDLRPNMHVIISGMDNVNVSDGSLNDVNHFSMFEFLITPGAPGKAIASIDINNNPNRWTSSGNGSGAVFAMNGSTDAVPEPATLALVVMAFAGTWMLRRKCRTPTRDINNENPGES